MRMIKIDNREYDFDALTPETKGHFESLQYVDAEIVRLTNQVAVFKTARIAYAQALNQALQPPSDPLAQQLAGDTIKLG